MAGHKGDAATWVDTAAWSPPAPTARCLSSKTYAKEHPITEDYGKTWKLALPESEYLYDEKATGADPPAGWDLDFPARPPRQQAIHSKPDTRLLRPVGHQPLLPTTTSPISPKPPSTRSASAKAAPPIFSASAILRIDYVGHHFGPRSREIQDILITPRPQPRRTLRPSRSQSWPRKLRRRPQRRSRRNANPRRLRRKPAWIPDFSTSLS